MHRLFGPEHSLHTPTLQAGPQPPPGFSHPPGGRCAGWPPRGPVPCRPTLQAAPHPPCRPSRHCVAVRSAPPMAQSIQDPRLAFVVDYDTHPPSAVRNVLGGQCPMDRKKVHSFFVVMNLSVPMTESGEFQAKGLLARIRRCTTQNCRDSPSPRRTRPEGGCCGPSGGYHAEVPAGVFPQRQDGGDVRHQEPPHLFEALPVPIPGRERLRPGPMPLSRRVGWVGGWPLAPMAGGAFGFVVFWDRNSRTKQQQPRKA